MTAWVIGDAQKIVCPLELTSLAMEQSGPHQASVVARMNWSSPGV
jgi:hypothetical protein